MKTHRYIIGIDEVGRGPIAGPVTVGAVCIPRTLGRRHFKGVKDSKKLTPKQRNLWFSRIRKMRKVHYTTSSVSSRVIDEKGIMYAIRRALHRSIARLGINPRTCLVLLDGGLAAPQRFVYQRTIVKGDEKEHVIALASIIAKVTRDRKMSTLGKKYPHYGFDAHKGYGTRKHYARLRVHGSCVLHRKSFLKI
ncbi:ribonuclease HII [Candidatus Kaiserbacteria bacterium]|nr:ribonuclease HII [Candidatus Kaiserbacteria bacterium]